MRSRVASASALSRSISALVSAGSNASVESGISAAPSPQGIAVVVSSAACVARIWDVEVVCMD
jgi:hypothetical protein